MTPDAPELRLRRVLHIEDNLADAELIHETIRRRWPGCEFRRVESREQLRTALAEPDWDLVLSDFSLPGFDGLSALALARERRPDVPFIFLSGTIGEDNAVSALQRGASDYVIKDRPARLVPAIEQALGRIDENRAREKIEAKLRASQELLQQLAEHSADAFWFADISPERFIYVSPAVEQIWGRPPRDFYASPELWDDGIHGDDRERVQASYQACLAGRTRRFEEEYRVVRADGTLRWVLDTGTPIFDLDGKLVRMSGIAKDVTDRRNLEKQYLRAQRLESVGTLAGGIAHDLNNVLAPILMAVDLLKKKTDNADIRRLLGILETSANHGAGLVRQVLAFARGGDGERSDIQPQLVAREVVKLLQETLPRSIDIESDLPREVGLITSNATELGQVLMNLCVNARDAMPDGGKLRIEMRNVSVDHGQAAANPGAKTGPHVLIRVSDTGTGIPAEIAERIFDPFFTTKAAGKGTGLGLATVLGIVRSHGGFLDLRSEPGEGTTFSLFFPMTAGSNSADEAPPAEPANQGRGESILIIDDEAAVRDVAAALVEAFGYRTFRATDGQNGLGIYRRHAAEIGVVMIDMMMPGMQGTEVIRSLRRENPDVGIIAMSGYLEPEKLGITAGMDHIEFVQKPMTGEALVKAIQRVLPKPS